jgi:hypothetical protein
MESMELKLESDVEELEELAKKKELLTKEENEEFERKAQELLAQLSQQEAVRLLVLEEFRKRILKAQEEYRQNQERYQQNHKREEKRFSMEEVERYLEKEREKIKTEENRESQEERQEEWEREKRK